MSKKPGDKEEKETLPDELRCRRSDGKVWRCNERRAENKTLCEKHQMQARKRQAESAAGGAGKRSKLPAPPAGPVESVAAKGSPHSGDIVSVPTVASSRQYWLPVKKRTIIMPESPPTGESLSPKERPTVSGHNIGSCADDTEYLKVVRDPSSATKNMAATMREDCLPPAGTEIGKKNRKRGPIAARGESKMCHQCQRNDKKEVVHCQKCMGRKRYCVPCITRWYPEMTVEDIGNMCPVCRGICNCKSCLRGKANLSQKNEHHKISGTDRLKYFDYVLSMLLPVVRKLNQEQLHEVAREATLHGDTTYEPFQRQDLEDDERLYCNNCEMSIVDLHRTCETCGYDLCLACIRDLLGNKQPGGELASSANEASKQRVIELRRVAISKGINFTLPLWRANDGILLCPPEERGGCGKSTLILCTLMCNNMVAEIVNEAEDLLRENQQEPEATESRTCDFCNLANNEDQLKAAHRTDSHDNYLYCPTSQTLKAEGIKHFQWHWRRGEPVIVKETLNMTTGLSWEPMVMWRAIREPKKDKVMEEAKSLKVIDCRDWTEVQMNIHKFFKGYEEGLRHKDGGPKMLKLNDWPSSGDFRERLPRHEAEFFAALPLHEFTHPDRGILNIASWIPHANICKRNRQPKTCIAYGLQRELGIGDSVTKLHCDMFDAVNILTHACIAKVPERQSKKVETSIIVHAEAQLQQCNQDGRERSPLDDKDGRWWHLEIGAEAVLTSLAKGLKDKMKKEDMELDNSGRISKDNDMVSERGDYSNARNTTYEQFVSGVQDHTHFKGQSATADGQVRSKVQTSLEENFDEIKPDTAMKSREKENESKLKSTESDTYGGALWDIFRREDASKVQDYVKKYLREFLHFRGEPLESIFHPIHDQTIYLTENHKKRLKEEYGVEAWTFEQHIGDAILIPAGCPHQVRNLKSCIKVDLDFVSLESIQECVRLREEFRLLPKNHVAKKDKLQVSILAVNVLKLVVERLRHAKQRRDYSRKNQQ